MSRVPRLRPCEMDTDQLTLYRGITEGPRASGPRYFDLTGTDGELRGPFNAFLLSPTVGTALSDLGAALRFGTTLSKRCVEIAILTTAASWGSTFERDAHEAVGRGVGLSEECLASLRAGEIPTLDDAAEAACARLAAALVTGHVDDNLWAASEAVLGTAHVFDVSAIIGYYSLLALQLRLFAADSD